MAICDKTLTLAFLQVLLSLVSHIVVTTVYFVLCMAIDSVESYLNLIPLCPCFVQEKLSWKLFEEAVEYLTAEDAENFTWILFSLFFSRQWALSQCSFYGT